jgi:hypothetical protein
LELAKDTLPAGQGEPGDDIYLLLDGPGTSQGAER